MAFEIRPHPEFSWSNSRDKTLAECARRYYWERYGSHNGWLEEADETAKTAYRLKNLTSYQMALGSAIHECAKRYAMAIRAGRRRPTRDQLRDRVRFVLNSLHTASRNRDQFLARPKKNPMLHAVYYGMSISDQQLERLRDRMERCLDHLVASPVWEDLERCSPDDVLVIDSLAHFDFNGVRVYAAPDLVYWCDGRWILVDWKTGAPDEDGEDGQIAVYALYLRDGLGRPFLDGECIGRIVNLLDGTDRTVDILQETVAGVEARIAESIERMRALVVDGDLALNAALEIERFPLREDISRCRWCPYFELCEHEIAQRASVHA